MAATLTVDCSKAAKELGLELKAPAVSVRDLCGNAMFQRLVREASA